MKNQVVGISGINATDNPGPGCAVARSLQKSLPFQSNSGKLVGLSYDFHDPGNYMEDLFSNSYLLPYPTKGWDGLFRQIQQIQKKEGLNILIPCLDAELPLMIKHQELLAQNGIQTLLPKPAQFDLRSKDLLPELSREIRCLHPKTVTVLSLDELVRVLQTEIPLPAVIKGKYYKAYVVYNIETAILKATEIASEWGFPLLVQERIEGQEVNMIGLSNHEGQVVGRVAIKKQLTTQLGKVWTAVTIREDRLDELCDRFGATTQWRGPFELECMINESGIHLIEINPRFPAWVYFATAVGVNLPERLLDLITRGQCNTSLDYPTGQYLVRYSSEFVTDLSLFQNLISKGNRKGL
jgi:carbamoyl-phosphate synthase large subunit